MNKFDILGQYASEMSDLIDDWAEKLGLHYNHFAVLYSLAGAEDGQCTQKQIGEEWYLPKQTVFNICKAYREQGWIEFFEGQSDKRERVMRLTEEGRRQAEPVYRATEAMFERVFAAFGKQKTERLFALMGEWNRVFEKEMEAFDAGKDESEVV